MILLGGVQINLPYPYECHWQPLYFKAWSKATASTPMDLLPELQYAPPPSAVAEEALRVVKSSSFLDVTPRRSRSVW